MKKKSDILCLSGWSQNSNSLNDIFDNLVQKDQIINFDYSKFKNIESFFDKLKNSQIEPQIIIGWSLGGQLAIRLIAEKIFKPKLLILLSTPFQFVRSYKIETIMPKTTFEEFEASFINDPNKTLKRFLVLMLMNDKEAKNNIKTVKDLYLKIDQTNHQNLIYWLKELGKFSASDLNFSNFPRTLIIHGQKDMVVNVSQSKILAKKIANSKLEIFNDCSHIVHLHNLEKLQSIIKKELNE